MKQVLYIELELHLLLNCIQCFGEYYSCHIQGVSKIVCGPVYMYILV